MNIKFSQRDVNGDNFYVSLLGNKDNSSFEIFEDDSRNNLSWENNIEKTQLGGAVFYNKNWDETGKTTIALSYSNLLTQIQEEAPDLIPITQKTELKRFQ